MHDRGAHPGLFAVGRLKTGVSLEQARAEMDAIAQNLATAYPDSDKNAGIVLAPLKEQMVGDVRPVLLMLLAAVGFVFVICCVNVANLLLARSTARAREFALRAALGATRGRTIRQLLAESAVLAVAGGALGLLLAMWGTRLDSLSLPQALPRANDVRLDSARSPFHPDRYPFLPASFLDSPRHCKPRVPISTKCSRKANGERALGATVCRVPS